MKKSSPSAPFNKKYIISGNVLQVYEYEQTQCLNMASNPNIDEGFNEKLAERSLDTYDMSGNMINSISEYVPAYDLEIKNLWNGRTKEEKLKIISDKLKRGQKQISHDLIVAAEDEEYEQKLIRKRINDKKNAIKKRNKLIRYVNSNPQLKTFLTLTFKDIKQISPDSGYINFLVVDDLEYANNEFQKFVKRLNNRMRKHGKKFEYVAVVEFQKRGAVHYHLLCNLNPKFHIMKGKISKAQKHYQESFAERFWRQGFVNVQPLTPNPQKYSQDVDNLGAYLVKYMTKEVHNNQLEGKKNYFTSRGLNKPIEIKLHLYKNSWHSGQADFIEQVYKLDDIMPSYSNTYWGYYTGNVIFKEYNLTRLGIVTNNN